MADTNFSKSDFQYAHLGDELEPRIEIIFNHTDGRNVDIKTKLNLRKVILMDSQLIVDLLCKSLFIGEDS